MKNQKKAIQAVETIADRVRWLREEKGLTKLALAGQAGVSYGAIQLIEGGVTRSPSYQVIAKLAAVFGVTEAYLVNGTKAPKQ